MNKTLLKEASDQFSQHFGRRPTAVAYAPGRVEILGNHTDYNEGYVLSAAINMGTFFLAAPSEDTTCRLVAGDLRQECAFDLAAPAPSQEHPWANYVKGVLSGLAGHGELKEGFLGLFLGNIPLGAGLSSSAALEVSAGLSLGSLYGIRLRKLTLAKIGQRAEHEFAGVKCGLLDQISSLYGRKNHLVMTDFRSLDVAHARLGKDALFLMCNTRAKHSLVDSAYNERRAKCEEAARFFASVVPHPVAALRDVSWAEWQAHASRMDPAAAKRSAHVIGENTRVLGGRDCLARGELETFGKLMFESHESSRKYFENSCEELDFIVATAAAIPGVLGARLSGGGFGGSAVVLVYPRDADTITRALASAYERKFGHPCDIRAITPSAGARRV